MGIECVSVLSERSQVMSPLCLMSMRAKLWTDLMSLMGSFSLCKSEHAFQVENTSLTGKIQHLLCPSMSYVTLIVHLS